MDWLVACFIVVSWVVMFGLGYLKAVFSCARLFSGIVVLDKEKGKEVK